MSIERNALPECTPEEVGISSMSVTAFLNELERTGVCLHSFLLIRHGKIAAECYWKPFEQDTLQRMYSITKSFVGVAVGLLINDGLLTLDEPVLPYFREKLMREPHPYTAKMTVRDLLTMQTVHTMTASKIVGSSDIVGSFFNVTPSHRSGTVFNYDSGASTVLGVLVEKLTGMSLMDYLRKKVLNMIGFSSDAYIMKQDGVTAGASGMMCTARDLAKFALLCMGNTYGFSLLPRQYMEDATHVQTDTKLGHHGFDRNGYGYQIWCLDKGFAFYGMGGQFAFCLPEEDLVVVTTGDTLGDDPSLYRIYHLVQSLLLPGIKAPYSIGSDRLAVSALQKRMTGQELPAVPGADYSEISRDIGGSIYRLDQNNSVLRTFSVSFGPNYGTLELGRADGSDELRFGFGANVLQLFGKNQIMVASSGAWVDDQTLFIRVWEVDENIGSLQILLHFGATGAFYDQTATLQIRTCGDFAIKGFDTVTSAKLQ